MQQIYDLLDIKDLTQLEPHLDDQKPFGYLEKERGFMAYLNQPKDYKFLAILEIKPGQPRGRHYHKEKIEMFYIISGLTHGQYWLPTMKQDEGIQHVHKPGDFITIQPGLCHEFSAQEPTLALEMTYQSFTLKDTFYPQ